jgi:hypothetical protein
MSRLYHKKVFWYADFDLQARALFNKNYSLHLFEHLLYSTDKHGMTMRELDRIIDELMENKRKYFLYEAQTDIHDNVYKCVLRTSYDLDRDISIIFALSKKNELIVRTAWLNNKSDFHNTLDKSKYYFPKKC